MPGMLRSITTTSGAVSATAWIAASPFAACAATSIPLACSSFASPSR